MREYPYLPGFSLLPVFFSGQQKACQAITSFIDAWVILSFGTDVASQETIIQRAILNTWITPQNHKLLTWLHVVILKCKDGKWEKNTEPERNLNGEIPKWSKRKKEHAMMRKMMTWKTKCYSTGVFFLSLLTESYFQNSAPRKNFFQLYGGLYCLGCL